MSNPEIQRHEEQPAQKEVFVPHFDVLVICGLSGAGKSRTGEVLADRYSIPFIKKNLRQVIKERRGEEIVDYAERTPEDDRDLDDSSMRTMREAKQNHKPIVLEGKLAGYFARKLEAEEGLSVVAIFLSVATDEVRFDRIWRRQVEENPALTLEEVRSSTLAREAGDLRQWRKVYPELANINPLDGMATDNSGRRLYDNTFYTDNDTVNQVVDMINGWLIGNGLVERKMVDKDENLPSQGDIYKAPKM